ncbi:hypothetical protein [Actinomadura viridis]|uniref:Uncharacterized protein n=1 Tax=Actinomadura viridis TaxID=58110 RepID=A0A931DL82_9ACTN|nr:hypothetical protein [Actinomadura viridis]MBG6093269.1 hypothetical protein [Actinomadura viridis]
MSEDRPLEPAEQNALFQEITQALTHALPPAWQECLVAYRALGSYSEMPGQVTMAAGSGLPSPFTPPRQVAELFERLRAGMYRPGTGTWFTATFRLTFPFTYDVRFDGEREPAWVVAPPKPAFAEERRRFPRDAEHTPDWLAERPAGGPELPIAKPFDSTGPDGRPVVERPEVPAEERDTLVRYLENAPMVLAARSFDADMMDPGRAREVPLTYHTDGTWIWPGAVGYYLRAHGVPPEPELVAHIRARGFEIPEVGDDVRSAAVAVITGSS